MKINMEWLSGKSEAEQRQLLDNSGIPYGWMNGYPRVSAEEAEALRNGKAYKLSAFDMERLALSTWIGCDGNPENDPFIIKGLSNGVLMENPEWAQEEAETLAKREQRATKLGVLVSQIRIGVGNGNRRWIATDAGKAFAKELGLS